MIAQSARTEKSDHIQLEIVKNESAAALPSSDSQQEGSELNDDHALVFAEPPRDSQQFEE